MTERDALLAAVCAAPDDDLPRLVFADWCDENGEADRAEFIRVQIELAKGANGERLAALQERERELLKEHRAAWTGDLREFTDNFLAEPLHFRRGFIESISINDELLTKHGDELFRRAPIRTLRMGNQDGFNDLHKCKHLLRITTLDLTVSRLDSTAGSPALFRSKYLANLTTLIARGVTFAGDDSVHMDAEALEGIVSSKYLTKLQRLDISMNWLFDRSLGDDYSRVTTNLLALGNLPALSELLLAHVGMGRVVGDLVYQPWLERIKVLDLRGNYIGDTLGNLIAQSPYLSNIDHLDLRDNVQYHARGPETRLSYAVYRLLKQRFGERVLLDE